MRRALLTIIAYLIVAQGTARAQVFYQFPDAAVVPQWHVGVGSFAAVADDDIFRLGVYGRFGFARYFDGGLELLLEREDGNGRGGVGGDIKFEPLSMNTSIPFDVSLNAGFGVLSSDDFRLIQIPLGAVFSTPFKLDSGKRIVPYVGAYLLFIDTEIDLGPAGEVGDTDVDVEARGGLSYELASQLDVFAALHLGRDTAFYLGLKVNL